MLEPLVPLSDLKVNELLRLANMGRIEMRIHYDDASGYITWIIREYEDRETVVHYVSDNIGILYDAEWKLIVGFQLEGLENNR